MVPVRLSAMARQQPVPNGSRGIAGSAFNCLYSCKNPAMWDRLYAMSNPAFAEYFHCMRSTLSCGSLASASWTLGCGTRRAVTPGSQRRT